MDLVSRCKDGKTERKQENMNVKILFRFHFIHVLISSLENLVLNEGEEQNREEGEMAQTKLGGGRNRGESREEGEKEK